MPLMPIAAQKLVPLGFEQAVDPLLGLLEQAATRNGVGGDEPLRTSVVEVRESALLEGSVSASLPGTGRFGQLGTGSELT